ncbi:hemocytin [Achroia grisella]|uniref:hemocytin n=1 Tax=Achroia grisella TaxID=688607 RepID=UPI0027D23770|nr:hemocytin [Achroia grisella]
MNLIIQTFIFLIAVYICDAGYGIPASPEGNPQSDVEAPAYVPSYLKNQKISKTGYTKTRSYSGTKTAYSGTKTGYSGYSGTKTSYSGTKTGYSGTKTSYSGTKSGYSGTKSGYGERKTWYSSSGQAPSYDEFHSNANLPYTAKCDPECKNNGICVDTNTCHCPANFHGRYCEFEKKPCLVYPPLPMNSNRSCSADFCTVQCLPGHKFIDGTTVANMRCLDGQWRPTRADFSTIPDCEPECNPSCQNGGICLSLNTCQCPDGYRGPQCQYSASACEMRKLAFNGGYSCFGDDDTYSCKLNCPSGSTFSVPPAPQYTCLYSTGVFEPQPIPHCVFNDVVVVHPSNYHNMSVYESHYNMSSSSQSSYGYSHSHSGVYGGSETENVVMVVQDLTPKGGTCLTWAGVHYKTFDGKIYSFESPCEHVLVRDAREHKYTVVVKHSECKRKPYCPSELTIYMEDKPYMLSVGEDGSVIFRSTKRLLPMPASLPGIRVSMPADFVLVNLDAAGVTIKWDSNNVVLVDGTVQLWNNTEGLCGTLDGNPENDMRTKVGTIAKTKSAMASSWQVNKIGVQVVHNSTKPFKICRYVEGTYISKADEDMKKALQFCTKVFSKEKFRKCSKVMDISMLLETCQWDYCACISSLSPEECACSTVSVYAKECLRHGVEGMKSWRDPDTCPMHCPEGKLYNSCGPDIQPSCAFSSPTKSDNSSCVEGCFCPEGQLLEGGKCVTKDECPCRLRNRSFKPGSVVPKDCNKCTCQAGEWSCTQVACGARCSAVGDPHYTTFDGLRYDFMGHCTYILLKTDNITVEVENVACSGAITEAMNLVPYKGAGKPSCTKSVTVNYDGARIHLKQGGFILVNGKEVTALPVTVGKIRIRAASSLFVIVQLPIKVDLWWDGSTRVFVDVPPALQGKTQGLCGTLNRNQKDDFLTPEGDIEQSALAFANKWKTRELCDDMVATEPEHPCKANIENKEAAEKYCSKLKSKLFEECHWYEDVEPYYSACVYDMCACGGDVPRCLCPALGHYAETCARLGVRLQWRYNVKECELSCTGGQEYTVCSDSCLRQCSDLALQDTCRPSCVEGCACPPGQVLDDNGACIPVGLCPCYHKGMKFNAEYKEVRPGRRERELCTCVGGRWECKPATQNDIQNYPPAEDLKSNCSATDHMEFTTCVIAEPLTCKNMHLPPSKTSEECRPGCQCKKGYVLDTSSKKCVVGTQCPCHHGGRSYPDGHVMQEECNTCECKSGNWSCTSRRCAGVCGAWGDSHLTTFDGADYDFEGVCTYLLAKGVMDSNDGFDIEIQNVPCGTTGATCSKSITLKVGSGDHQEVVSLTRNAPLPDVSKLKRITLRVGGAYVFVEARSLGVRVQWDRELRVYVTLESLWQGRVKGLCGNYNSDLRDDFQTPSGGGIAESSALIFADSWKLKPTCPKAQPVTDYCKQRPERNEWAVSTCSALKRYPFSLCHSEVSADRWMQRCTRDACACDSGADCACACAALAAYAHACSLRGVVLRWRTPQLCPMQCDDECSNYDPCMSACPLETCDNTIEYAEIKTNCEQEISLPGCKPKKSCPEGSVYSNGTLTECVPRAKCKPLCMTLPDGKEILEGEIIEEDACHTCRCSKKSRVCTGQPCSTIAPRLIEESTTSRPHDEPLKCVTGWTEWISRHTPEAGTNGQSVEKEPLPEIKELEIGTSMCNQDMMTKIECRTKVNHQSPKETGLDAECSLERGLLCRETGGTCPDFEIRVYCECEEQFQCLNADRPSYPHPKNCSQFYECTPDLLNPDKPHTVLKSCVEGTMYNNNTMVCDWPAAVIPLRPECGQPQGIAATTTYIPEIATSLATAPRTPTQTTAICPPGLVYSDCAYPCDSLCDHFKKTLQNKSRCIPGEKCVEGCVPETQCGGDTRWRDENTCVPINSCTCYDDLDHIGSIVKPGGVVKKGCRKCQCLNNELHCDSSLCTTEEITTSTTTTTTTTPAPTVPSTTFIPVTSTVPPTVAPTTATTSTPLIVPSTVSPPPECSPDSYKNLLWGDEPLEETAFSASSVANELFEPQYAVLDGHPLDITAGSWAPKKMDKDQYIQVEFPRREPVYGVILQGSPLFDQYVTSYELMYGDDGHVFSVVNGPDGNPKVFRGPVDHEKPSKQMIEPPIEAKFVRIRPLTWNEEIAVRFELIGCQEPSSTTELASSTSTPSVECTDALGLAADLPVENIEVSSNNDARKYFTLDAERGWTALYSTPGEWIMFDFISPRIITGIKTKGGPSGWVTTYNVMFTSDLSTFNPVLDNTGSYKVFPGNFDSNTVVFNEFKLPIHARYLKVLPLTWKKGIEMRVEPIGCFEPYPTTTASPLPEEEAVSPASPCARCPGVQPAACACAPARYYDGDGCVPRDQCPCIQSFMTYAVGTTFRGSNCDDCVCKLGGITICKPVKECVCAPNLVPKLLTSNCECLCEPCPEGTRICPTSKLCLPLDKWCDGLQDCPDDEVACTTTTSTTTPTTTVTTRKPLEQLVLTTVAPTLQAAPLTTATSITTVTTPKPVECPKVECPPGYLVRYTSTSASSYSTSSTSDLPPPRPRYSYQRYYKGGGGYSKGGFSKGGYSKGGYSKGGFSKGGYGGFGAPAAQPNRFTLEKPANSSQPTQHVCPQFKCVPRLPPYIPGTKPAPRDCSAPVCPPHYTLRIDSSSSSGDNCPQYVCVPPPERPVFCNITGRTFTTFDGVEYKYDVCFHILARDNRFDAWTVLVRKKCRLEGCQNYLIVHQDDQLIMVKPNLMIEYDNYEYTVEQTSKICFQKNSFDVDRLGNGLSIKSRKYNITVLYSRDGDIKIGVSKKYMGAVDGLCGAFDGSQKNERRLPDGQLATSVDEFGRAWAKPGLPADACKTAVIAQEKQKRAWDLCHVITKEPLSKCGKVLNLDKWRSICLEKICECADLVVNGTKRTDEECRCLLIEQMVAECLAADKNLDVTEWRMQMDCPADCPPPLVHNDCYRKRCEPTCSSVGAAGRSCPVEDGQCFPGCYCPEGKLRKGDQCVLPTDCLDCSCKGVGTPASYTTFEGDEFPFLSNCTYLASRDRNETGLYKYQVYATNGPCEDKADVTCTKIVHILYADHILQVTKDNNTNKLQLTIDKTAQFKFPLKKDWVTATQINGQDITLLLTEAHVEVSVLYSKMEFTVNVPSYIYNNRTEGLCGVCGGQDTALVTSNGTVTEDIDEYGESWQATGEVVRALQVPAGACGATPPPACGPPPPDDNPCLALYNAALFGECHALVEPQTYVESCEAEQCALNTSDACATFERYAAACRRQGVCLHWRDTLCPYNCSKPLVYRSCVDCERTCENNDELTKDPKKCKTQPAEGCFCPEGLVRVNNTCIEPNKCFPCDAKKEHYAGDEWQEDACKKCTCSKVEGTNEAHVSCQTQTCTTPVCGHAEDMLARPTTPGACCLQYVCVPKPIEKKCKEPKKMECGFGQVLKQKTTPNGCKEFSCECKPASECEPIPNENEVDIIEPGMERVVDASGCCPRVQFSCRPETCPHKPDCPKFHNLTTTNVPGKCCPEYKCELPTDRCVVTLEWEAAPKGGEKPRKTPEIVLKDVDEVWLDGPCRSCGCGAAAAGPRAECATAACAPVPRDAQLVWEAQAVPFACCPRAVPVACRDGDDIYRVGENWTSPYNPCESYACVEVEDGKLDKVTTVQRCDTDCQAGWKYFPAAEGGEECCGKCRPVACVVDGRHRNISEEWTSDDFCTNYTCVDVNGTLQVQSSDETCPEVSDTIKKLYVLQEQRQPGKCCPKHEAIACKVGDKVYQENETWPTSDPCRNVTCSRDEEGRLVQAGRVQHCSQDCPRGRQYRAPHTNHTCCGDCVAAACLDRDKLRQPGESWQSDDKCTTFSCDRSGDELSVTVSREACPDVSACAPEDLVNSTCCQLCVEKPQALSKCVPESIPPKQSIGLIRLRGPHGLCINKQPLTGFKECRGTCDSGTIFNNKTGSHDSSCECCQVASYERLVVALRCEDGVHLQHSVATPARCTCRRCGDSLAQWPTTTGSTNTKVHYGYNPESYDEVPEIYQRFGTEKPSRN